MEGNWSKPRRVAGHTPVDTGPHPPFTSEIHDTQTAGYIGQVSESLDVDAMIQRYQQRAKAVKSRPMPPVEGAERKLFVERAQTDFMDYAIIGDAIGAIEDGFLVLRVDLRPSAPPSAPPSA